MATRIIRRYAGGYRGHARFSIRQRPDGSFQAFHDNQYEGCGQPDGFDVAISGLFADLESAEAELRRYPSFKYFD